MEHINYQFIIPIRFIKLAVGSYIHVRDGIYLSNDLGRLYQEGFINEGLISQIGAVGIEDIKKNSFAIWKFHAPVTHSMVEIAWQCNGIVFSLMSLLWFSADNSIFNVTCYLQNVDTNAVMRDQRDLFVCHSDSSYHSKEIKKEDIDQMIELENIYKSVQSFNTKSIYRTFNEEKVNQGDIYLRSYNEGSRITRSLSFLNSARTTPLLPLKITFYFLLLECLFVKDEGKVIEKLSNRTARYLTNILNKQDAIVDFLRDAYNIRSFYVHGVPLKPEHHEINVLKGISVEIDDIVRKVLNKVFKEVNRFQNDSEWISLIKNLYEVKKVSNEKSNITYQDGHFHQNPKCIGDACDIVLYRFENGNVFSNTSSRKIKVTVKNFASSQTIIFGANESKKLLNNIDGTYQADYC